jgi:hypothetical protein
MKEHNKKRLKHKVKTHIIIISKNNLMTMIIIKYKNNKNK